MSSPLSFENWKELLRRDCIACDKLLAFNNLGESILRLLYENQLDPTVQAIVSNGINGKPEKPAPRS